MHYRKSASRESSYWCFPPQIGIECHGKARVDKQKGSCFRRHAVFCGQEATINWCLGKGDLSQADFEREFKRLKPSLLGSDAHKIERLCKPENGKFCWIKADPTFEGLKQIVYEPELRVKIQTEDPTESETYAKIATLTFSLPQQLAIKDDSEEKTDFCMNGTYNVEFSNNLTCIIGGRGSGKSTLAHVIYNSWINHDIKELSAISSPLLSLEMPPNPLKKIAECTACEVPSQTEFFFQNEIEHAAKSIESMSTLIRHRLEKLSSIDGGVTLDKLGEYWNTSLKNVHELIEAYDRVSEIDGDISKAQEDINTLKRQTEIIKSSEYMGFQLRIGDLSGKVSDFKSYQTDFQKLIKQIDSLITTIDLLNWNLDQGEGILDSLLQTLRRHKGELNVAFAKFSAGYNAQDFPGQLNLAQQDLRQYLKARGLSPENVQEIAQANTKIKELEEEIRVSQLEKKPYKEIYESKEQIIEEYEIDYKSYKDRFLKVSSSLQEKLSGLSISQKEVKFYLIIDHTRLKNNLVDFVKDSIEDDTILRYDAIERLLFDDKKIITYIENKQTIRNCLSESTKAEKHRQIIQELINDNVFLEKLHLRMLKDYFSIDNIQVQTKLGGKLLKNTSFGERCGIVIAIILVAGTNPIVIDQPEDHLDGKFISDVLVPLLRNQKHNRQIILITRDANVVVGGDAELIHILEPTDQRTQVLPSSIENIQHREKYIWILDGGADAFARREQKYDIDLLRSQRQNSS
jgi:energy-coupling factor transporter ATP-binding protein EcfA2